MRITRNWIKKGTYQAFCYFLHYAAGWLGYSWAQGRSVLCRLNLKRIFTFTCQFTQPPLNSPDGSLITGSVEKANTFNEYCVCVFTTDDNKTPVTPKKIEDACMLSSIEFSLEKDYKALRLLKSNCSFGSDGRPSLLLHNFARVMSEPLSYFSILYFGVNSYYHVG